MSVVRGRARHDLESLLRKRSEKRFEEAGGITGKRINEFELEHARRNGAYAESRVAQVCGTHIATAVYYRSIF